MYIVLKDKNLKYIIFPSQRFLIRSPTHATYWE